ncbi:hypothetical protein MRX96_002086 [Rhipicephalus microplus]
MASKKRQTPDDRVPITRGIAGSTALISAATTVTDASDNTPNANLGLSTTLKNMKATPSTSMKQLRSRPRRSGANRLTLRFLPNPHDLQTHRVLRVHNADPSQGSGSSGSDSAKQGLFKKPRCGSPPRQA